MRGWFVEEPRFLDIRHLSSASYRSPADHGPDWQKRLRSEAATLAAAIRGVDLDQLGRKTQNAVLSLSSLSLQRELRIKEEQLLEQASLLAQQQDELQERALRIRELAEFDERSATTGGVFISYSHTGKDIVDALTARFELDDIAYWRDDKDLLVGDVIDKAVSKGIQQAVLFLIVLTPGSINSRWVERELDEAAHEEIETGKVILPVVSKNLTEDQIPRRLRRKLYVDLSGQNFDAGYDRLLRSIRSHLTVRNN
jgi:hypothetical protein